MSKDDPYGTVVDRCARIVSICGESIVLASSDYVHQLQNKDNYVHLGSFSLRGIQTPQAVFICNLNLAQNILYYLADLLEELNLHKNHDDGYRYVSRSFAASDFELLNNQHAKPFLVRELLRVPKVPYSLQDFISFTKGMKDFELRRFVGYLVEWEGYWNSYQRIENYLYAFIRSEPTSHDLVGLILPSYMNEIVSTIPISSKVRVRGILVDVKNLRLNFVDLATAPDTYKQPGQEKELKQDPQSTPFFQRLFSQAISGESRERQKWWVEQNLAVPGYVGQLYGGSV